MPRVVFLFPMWVLFRLARRLRGYYLPKEFDERFDCPGLYEFAENCKPLAWQFAFLLWLNVICLGLGLWILHQRGAL